MRSPFLTCVHRLCVSVWRRIMTCSQAPGFSSLSPLGLSSFSRMQPMGAKLPPILEASAIQFETVVCPTPHNWLDIFLIGPLRFARNHSVFFRRGESSFASMAVSASWTLQINRFSNAESSFRDFSCLSGARPGRGGWVARFPAEHPLLLLFAALGTGVQKATAPNSTSSLAAQLCWPPAESIYFYLVFIVSVWPDRSPLTVPPSPPAPNFYAQRMRGKITQAALRKR